MNRRGFLLGILGAAVAASPAAQVGRVLGGAIPWAYHRRCARCGVDVDTDPDHKNGGLCPRAMQDLVRALEAGGYNAAPSELRQGCVLQVEDLSPVMAAVTFDSKDIGFYKSVRRQTFR